ncbi:hypothetical protein [Polyangium aurulentum]|uniref:hypothetical protein n=1 Tax=Polyangium aurulentum TaxID=2567896 RepID=UPI0010AE6B49|nr:hypothetical protein [Polyangium aurulentum]UQA57719.1 hypothetical protein E8A73_041630 [Polyangium aurulentum]
MDNGIPPAVLQFLEHHITSIEQLEVLLLLREHAGRAWTAEEVSRHLRSSVMSIQGRLNDLASRRLLAVEPVESGEGYVYSPGGDEIARIIDGLAKAYKERRLTIINHIYGRPPNELRSFADAFLLKKK